MTMVMEEVKFTMVYRGRRGVYRYYPVFTDGTGIPVWLGHVEGEDARVSRFWSVTKDGIQAAFEKIVEKLFQEETGVMEDNMKEKYEQLAAQLHDANGNLTTVWTPQLVRDLVWGFSTFPDMYDLFQKAVKEYTKMHDEEMSGEEEEKEMTFKDPYQDFDKHWYKLLALVLQDETGEQPFRAASHIYIEKINEWLGGTGWALKEFSPEVDHWDWLREQEKKAGSDPRCEELMIFRVPCWWFDTFSGIQIRKLLQDMPDEVSEPYMFH